MMPPRIILDLSRLLSRTLHATPTGVDRVEMAYARGLLDIAADRLAFAAVHPTGIYGRLPTAAVLRFLDQTEAKWRFVGATSRWALRRGALGVLRTLRPRPLPRIAGAEAGTVVYVQSSPHHLTRPALVQAILRRERAKFVCMVHDLIPLEYPEYARPEGAVQHRVRMSTVTRLADGIIANSHATLASLQPYLTAAATSPRVAVAHLGTLPSWSDPPAMTTHDPRPYFVCLGTIEPRKNHLLLLNLWRRMAEERGSANVPRLVLIGRRGWENEQIVDMLERCPALVGCVEEHGGLPDHETRRLLGGARALLMPSFAEGYGMPVAEALDAGVPVICSDLPSLREAGGGVPLFLDPLDGPAWRRAIDEYAEPHARGRQEQLVRLHGWQRPTWTDHIAQLNSMIEDVAS